MHTLSVMPVRSVPDDGADFLKRAEERRRKAEAKEAKRLAKAQQQEYTRDDQSVMSDATLVAKKSFTKSVRDGESYPLALVSTLFFLANVLLIALSIRVTRKKQLDGTEKPDLV
ncbi:hypothetical protein ASPZODRAFT_131729 [Penicilliopsis zonata CBS 506.65]|uniref:Uncharacterized protein n=1 Tax=Penicilliopsis zonata CBS 506.65 TaxID=1073090 RepID=A0A1L9SI00_9EURO|nr:hypothetical protein ASPZODRAFT_131729 [Penicilliopsis zonata CBS 506.65]OJJ46839.1 hypothetical protein ASPZODRAFT_131729 [Penicilliopsis zonata CBS 506.65]